VTETDKKFIGETPIKKLTIAGNEKLNFNCGTEKLQLFIQPVESYSFTH